MNAVIRPCISLRTFAVMRPAPFFEQRVFIHPGHAIEFCSASVACGTEHSAFIGSSADGMVGLTRVPLVRPDRIHPPLPMFSIPFFLVPIVVRPVLPVICG